jgi:nucleoside 2-deoxyribosyltransferase
MPLCYLAGPITGLTYYGSTDWRKWVTRSLRKHGITPLDPMRGKAYLATHTAMPDEATNPLSTAAGVVSRDHFDTTRADMLLVNFLGATERSIGTVMEIAWAHHCHIPIVMIMEAEGNPNDHAMVRECAKFRCDTLERGISLVCAILSDEEAA